MTLCIKCHIRVGGEPSADSSARRMAHSNAILRCRTHDGLAARCYEVNPEPLPGATDGIGGDPFQTADESGRPGSQDLPQPSPRCAD